MNSLQKYADNIYFHHDVLIQSNDNNNLDILTISSFENILEEEEDKIEGLFEVNNNISKRCRKFKMLTENHDSQWHFSEPKNTNEKACNQIGKKFFFLSARVHPGETVSSYILDGFIDFITSSDPRAIKLRVIRTSANSKSMFVFKIIPMLNPDGYVSKNSKSSVRRGHYRGDLNGVNLNRVYDNPDKSLHPTIWATKEYLKSLKQLSWYIDLHGHANKHGSFLFGNWTGNPKSQYEMLIFAKCISLNIPNMFEFSECDFTPKGMINPTEKTLAQANRSPEEVIRDQQRREELKKDGTGRVCVYKLTSNVHCYSKTIFKN